MIITAVELAYLLPLSENPSRGGPIPKLNGMQQDSDRQLLRGWQRFGMSLAKVIDEVGMDDPIIQRIKAQYEADEAIYRLTDAWGKK